MAFPSLSFPASTPLFPRAHVVLEYLNDYARWFGLMEHVRLGRCVSSVRRREGEGEGRWVVTTVATSVGGDGGEGREEEETAEFDLVVVCNGHYRVPFYPTPSIKGLAAWLHAGRASHSAYYRRPHAYAGTVLVIGGGPSGLDIVADVRGVVESVIHSINGDVGEDVGNLKRRGRVVEFHEGGDGRVTFEDGTSESGIAHCILATGYEFSFPFLHDASDVMVCGVPPPAPAIPRELYNTRHSIFPLAKHIFPIHAGREFPPWSLAFMGRVLTRVAPFPVFEAQARAVVRVFGEPRLLDAEMEEGEFMERREVLRERYGEGMGAITKGWHRLKPLDQYGYRKALDAISGSRVGVGEWEEEMYVKRVVLREMWVELEKRGEGEEWVGGVGEQNRDGEEGKMEWVAMMKTMLKTCARGNEEGKLGVPA